MTFELLDATNTKDRARWLDLWRGWPSREVHAHPTYGEIFARPGIDRVIALAHGDGESGLLFPAILRPLAAEDWCEEGTEAWDLVTPYGYGGAFGWGTPRLSAEEVLEAIDVFAARTNVVSAFLRLSLFDSQLVHLPGERVERMMNIVRSLNLEDEAFLYDYAHKVRKNLKRAQRSGLCVEFDATGTHLDAFRDIYLGTMERQGAGDSFFFDRAFFERIVEEMPGCFVFVHVRDGSEEIVSTELVLLSAHHAYSFLGGTRSEAFAMRPNDLLKHELIRWLRDGGYEAFVLGGGYGEDDGIYRYKKAFAPTGTHPFRTQSLVLNRSVYDALVEERASWELARGCAWAPQDKFFPAYRS